jgi:serine/threonine-protein kinase
MGRVLEAWDPVLKRSVALKLLYGRDPEHLVRALREAQSQARLDHPNVCRVLEVEAEAEQPFIAMALIQGKPLGDLRLQLDALAIARIMADVAGAIHAAHKAGIVHRDLKPQNILVEALPESGWMPFVVDFGLARDLAREDQTLSWAMVGTPAFMSPQQAQGEPARPADDIYSLGATLYALLGGVPPHEAATLAGLISQQVREDPRPLRRLLPRMPKDLETIVAKCLEGDPGSRYASAFDLESDVRRFLAGEPIMARPVSTAAKLWRRMKRHRTLSLTVAAASILVIGLLGWNLHTRIRARRQVEVAQRFGMEIKEIESLLRIERMLPVHDMRPVEGQMRTRLDALRQSMTALGPMAEGPGQYALGRGFLAMRDYGKALEALERAWERSYRPPEAATALAEVHMALGEPNRIQRDSASSQGETIEEARRRWEFHKEKALWFFRFIGDLKQPLSAYAQAQIAYLERRYESCRRLCDLTLQEQPWRYEALLLAGNSVLSEIDDGHANEGRAIRGLIDRLPEASVFLTKASNLARSDLDVQLALNRAAMLSTVLESEGGSPTLGPIASARVFCETALRIQPDDRFMKEWQALVGRETILRLAAGEDTRQMCRSSLERGREIFTSAPKGLGAFGEFEVVALWLLGESQWRRGENPRPALEKALVAATAAKFNYIEINNLLSKYEGQHGKDITGRLKQSEQLLTTMVEENPKYYYLQTLWGECLTVRAQWELWTGRDAREASQRGKAHLEEAIRRQPNSVYSYFHLPLLHAMEARLLLVQGKDARAAAAAALRTARAGAAIRANHYRTQLALAEAHHVAALVERQAGHDPVSHLGRARQAIRDAWALNGTDWRIALAESRLALTQAEVDQAAGRAAGATLLVADRAAEKGLRVKADAPELLLCRAEATRRRARWQGDAKVELQAATFTQKAWELCPGMTLPAGG